jgi:hypothetical protein
MIIDRTYPPPEIVKDALIAATSRVTGRIEIYEQDGITRWAGDKLDRLIEGSVNVDYSRDERRTLDLTLDASDGGIVNAPGYFWYDKVIKVFKRLNLRTADKVSFRTNLIPTPSFEQGSLFGWAAQGTPLPTVTITTEQAAFGSKSLKINSNGVSSFSGVSCTVSGLTVGQVYVFSLHAYVPSGSVDIGTIVNGTGFGTSVNGIRDQWVRCSMTFTATSTSHSMGAIQASTTSGQIGYIDGVMLEKGSSLGSYFDGSYTSGAAWTGTVGNSTSVKSSGTGGGFDAWEYQVGEFMIDSIDEDYFPHHMHVAGRDYTKKCMNSKFILSTKFDPPNVLETLIGDIAANAGITKKILPKTGVSIKKASFSFDRGTSRWDAMKQIANAYNYDIFFDSQGFLRMQLFPDPATQNPNFTFRTGSQSNLSDFKKSTDDSQLYNHVLVVGAAQDSDSLPTWAEAKNTTQDSPTSIAEIGDRLYEYDSDFIVLRRNIARNPRCEPSTNAAVTFAGTGGVVTLSNPTDHRPGSAGTKCIRATWTTGNSNVAGGIGMSTSNTSTKNTTVLPGDIVSIKLWVRCNKTQHVAPRIQWRAASDASLSDTVGTVVTLAANTWTELILENKVAPAKTDHCNAAIIVDSATGTSWAVNDWIQIDDVLIEKASSVGDYFDGGYYACHWNGTADATSSVSNQQAQSVADSFLSVHQLEQFSLDLTSLNIFYLDVGRVCQFVDPQPAPNDPDTFLLQTLEIPIGLGTMSATAGRVTNVGGT